MKIGHHKVLDKVPRVMALSLNTWKPNREWAQPLRPVEASLETRDTVWR